MILHTGDFKLDLTPVDGRRTDLARIGQLAKTEGIRLLLADSTNAEEAGARPSETSVGGVLRTLFAEPATGGSSPPASPATSTASSRSPTRPSTAAARWRRSG